MSIRAVRRIAQGFFLLLFFWFCIVSVMGDQWWQLRGWPINWFLQLDPLVGLGTLLTTHSIYSGLLWGVATIALTILLGRFFCGWICPFGCMHQMVGVLGKRGLKGRSRMEKNKNRPSQRIKYWILIFLLGAAAGDLISYVFDLPATLSLLFWILVILALIYTAVAAAKRQGAKPITAAAKVLVIVIAWAIASRFLDAHALLPATLQTGLLDPIPLVHRSVNLIVLPQLNRLGVPLDPSTRLYDGAWIIGMIFMAALLLNLWIPRFYCRFICPLGALFGVFSRFAVWGVRKNKGESCTNCQLCELNCEGACTPTERIRFHECVLCLNCLDNCPHGVMGYGIRTSWTQEHPSTDVSRREFNVALIAGVASVPMVRLTGLVGPNWNHALIRPPGALTEKDFLTRCIKCGQCMRICPTNVIHPAVSSGGIEGLWTPRLNFRIGTSGCQFNCIACGNVCPTAAIRPLSLDERLGRNDFSDKGPVKIGTAFVERGRCLPWAMNRPCIVCQENCPVSPKAITVRVDYDIVLTGSITAVSNGDTFSIGLPEGGMTSGAYATGDYYIRTERNQDVATLPKIISNTEDTLVVSGGKTAADPLSEGGKIEIMIRLQRPVIHPDRCIGCGVCEHECPVKGRRAIRVSAENESRNSEHRLLV